jgi:hypothetical protein
MEALIKLFLLTTVLLTDVSVHVPLTAQVDSQRR